MRDVHVYDLDGTLSLLNNTYDFGFSYLLHKKKIFRYVISKGIHFLIHRISLGSYQFKRKLLIGALFYGLSAKKLTHYFNDVYKQRFLETLSPLGKEVLKQDNSKSILLTACTSIPAYLIADLFGFQKTICTEFEMQYGIITGIFLDTYGNLKSKVFEKDDTLRYTYFTDTPHEESSLYTLMDSIEVVNYV